MKIYRLQRVQYLPIPIAEAWEFFSNPHNLCRITPLWMDFKVTCDIPGKMHAGMIITYRIKPVFGIPVQWITEITHVQEPCFFVDEQRFGPYRFWHHQHLFKEVQDGTEMRDIVHYVLPFGVLGAVMHGLFVSDKLNEIFDFRKRTLEQQFGKPDLL